MIYKIDATNQPLGRLASKIALILSGKNSPSYRPNVPSGNDVKVSNVSKIKLTGGKLQQKLYYRYSGYPGGIKKVSLKDRLSKNPKEVLRHATYGMLPKNKMRDKIIRSLKIE